MIARVDVDHSGELDFEEFVCIMDRYNNEHFEEIENAWNDLDTDHDGYATKQEFKSMFRRLPEGHLTDRDHARILRAADANGDSGINYPEFVAAYGEMGLAKTKDVRKTLNLISRMATKLQIQAEGTRLTGAELRIPAKRSAAFVKMVATVYSKENREMSCPDAEPFRGAHLEGYLAARGGP